MTAEQHPASPESGKSQDRKNVSGLTLLAHLALLLIAGLILYWPVLRNDFVYNDIAAIANNPALGSDTFVASIFTPEGSGGAIDGGYYAPITNLSYSIDYRLYSNPISGLVRSSGVHSTGLILYMACCILAYLLAALLTRRAWVALLIGAFFLVHPMHAENVNFAASRGETLAALFVLGMLLVSWTRPKRISLLVPAAALCFFMALFGMLSSPAGLAAPLLLLLVDWKRKHAQDVDMSETWGARYLPVLAALAVWAGLNFYLFGSLVPVEKMNAYAASLGGADKILLPLQVMFRYVALTVFPYPPTVIYNPFEAGSHALLLPGIAAAGIVIALLIAALVAWRKARLIAFGLLWLIVALIPIAIYAPWQTLIAESRLLLPSFGLCVFVAAILFAIADETKPLLEGARNTIMAVVAIMTLALFAAIGWNRGEDWKDALTLWTAEQERHPKEEMVLASLGFLQFQKGDAAKAEETLREAVKNYKSMNDVYYQLAFVLASSRKPAEAAKVLDEAMNLKGADGEFYSNLGLLYENLQLWDKAIAAYQKGIEVDPDNQNVRFNLGNVLVSRKQYDEAIEQYSKGMANLPESARAAFLINRSIAYRRANKLEESIADAEELKKVDPFEPRAYTLIAASKLAQSRAVAEDDPSMDEKRQKLIQGAVEVLQEGAESIPTPDRELLLRLSHMQYTLGYPEQALFNARRVSQAYPRDLRTQIFLGTLLISTNQFQEVGRLYLKAMKEIPGASKDPRLLAGLGYAFFQLGQYEDARKLCEQSLKISKVNAMGLLLYRRLMERKIPVNVDLSGMPASPIFPAGVPEPEIEEFTFDEPVELGTP